MEKGTKVKIKSTGLTGVIADGNVKLVNVTIDEKHLAPGDDKQQYCKPDDVEELKEEVAEEKPATETTTESTNKIEEQNEGANFLQQLVESLQSQVKLLEAENVQLKEQLAKATVPPVQQ